MRATSLLYFNSKCSTSCYWSLRASTAQALCSAIPVQIRISLCHHPSVLCRLCPLHSVISVTTVPTAILPFWGQFLRATESPWLARHTRNTDTPHEGHNTMWLWYFKISTVEMGGSHLSVRDFSPVWLAFVYMFTFLRLLLLPLSFDSPWSKMVYRHRKYRRVLFHYMKEKENDVCFDRM